MLATITEEGEGQFEVHLNGRLVGVFYEQKYALAFIEYLNTEVRL